MNLISKKSAVSRISDLLMIELKGQRIPTWNEVYNAIGDIPSVPAVPLELLANWLAEYAAPPVSECCVTADERTAAWKAVLNKFVEEQQDD